MTKIRALQRRYSQRTLKILFALSRNQCAEPSCTRPIISPATPHSDQLVVGQIAHIYAIGIDGPRGRNGLTEDQLNEPGNLILLCPTHHVVVDGQHATYPASKLLEWKARHEQKFVDALSGSVSAIGFAEIEVVARSIMSGALAATPGTLQVIPVEEKIQRNGLSATTKLLLTMGGAKSHEVAEALTKAAQLDSDFPERLRSAFVKFYRERLALGSKGDELFSEMYDWASGVAGGKLREAAGLCILTHLFIICDVFEK